MSAPAPDAPLSEAASAPRWSGRRRLIVAATVVFSVAVGIAAGIGGYTFIYAKGASYLTNDPRSCANCHIMQNHFDAWQKSSHHAVAVCNDCHTPKPFVSKWLVKGLNGWNHSLAFTTQRFHEPLTITPFNLKVTENACRRCHQAIVEAIDLPHHAGGEKMSCVRCHPHVGHAE